VENAASPLLGEASQGVYPFSIKQSAGIIQQAVSHYMFQLSLFSLVV
jgi:hypothetical protein